MPKILFIRGGAIGDFVLTLPSIALVREGFPQCRIEVLGYRHIVELATGRRHVDASRSIEYGPLGGFFSKNNVLDPGLCEYFAGFQQVVSYLYDPDSHFETNVRRAGVKNFLGINPIISDGEHAARQLARPLESLALYLEDHAARLHPNAGDFAAADEALLRLSNGRSVEAPGSRWLMVHPGSGSPSKNWPVERWAELLRWMGQDYPQTRIVLVAGEADSAVLAELRKRNPGLESLENLALPILAALAARCGAFIGHDSGISHIAAAAGAKCVLLFGPTDPDIWAPANETVEVLLAPQGDLAKLELETVKLALVQAGMVGTP